MANFLSALLQGLAQQNTPTDVEGVDVVAKLPPKPIEAVNPQLAQTGNIYPDEYIQLAQQASQAKGQLPRVSAGTDRGLFGFLPERIQQGRFRDVLGAIGDGILIGGGHKPIYGPRQEQLQMGQALLGYDQNPEEALIRLMQTGAPGAVELGQKGLQALETREQKAAQQEVLNNYRQQQIDLKRYQAAQQLQPYLRSIMSTVKDDESYANAWNRISNMMTRMGIKADATEVFGIPGPNDYEEGILESLGLKANEIQISRDKAAQRAEQRYSTDARSASQAASVAQRERASQRSTAARREATAARSSTKPTSSSGLTPKGSRTGLTPKASSAGGVSSQERAQFIQQYRNATPAQKAAARKVWSDMGLDVRDLK